MQSVTLKYLASFIFWSTPIKDVFDQSQLGLFIG